MDKVDRLNIRDVCLLRMENRRLKEEREHLVRIAGAALVLMRDLDADTYETFEAAELMAQCLEHLPKDVLDEALSLSS